MAVEAPAADAATADVCGGSITDCTGLTGPDTAFTGKVKVQDLTKHIPFTISRT
ncbi:hypothetical protein ACFC1R_20460 [Kitasatospora sp. NPDC056138]|uniref:hypothetical protein n=1 Tax=Kitasatospora sp. NPDC056138 TaxID=3345724 RepID=UPI0035DC9457